MKRKKFGKRTILAAAIVTMAAAFAFTQPAMAKTAARKTETAPQGAVTTSVTGLNTAVSRTDWDSTLTDTVKVKPAYGRKVKLYYYDPAQKKYVLKKTYTTADQETAKVKLKYPALWKSRYQTKWKIVIPKKGAFTRTTVPAAGASSSSSSGSAATSGGAAVSGSAAQTDGTGETVDVPESKRYAKVVTVTTKYLNCVSAVVYDPSTRQVVYAKNPVLHRKPASMTKMMTALLLAENVSSWSQKIAITAEAANTPWGIGVKQGDQIRAKHILYAMMLPSANDAACAAGIAIGGTTAKFAAMMNARAKELGANDTYYQNAHGIDTAGNYSTALDTARIGAYLMQSEDAEMIRKAMKTKKYTFTTVKKKIKYTLYTTDAMLSDDSYDFEGIKTGTTTLGGCCFCGAFNYEGKQYISVVMGASSNTYRWSDTRKLADFTEYAVEEGLGEYAAQ